jgi:hypothetical protein
VGHAAFIGTKLRAAAVQKTSSETQG